MKLTLKLQISQINQSRIEEIAEAAKKDAASKRAEQNQSNLTTESNEHQSTTSRVSRFRAALDYMASFFVSVRFRDFCGFWQADGNSRIR